MKPEGRPIGSLEQEAADMRTQLVTEAVKRLLESSHTTIAAIMTLYALNGDPSNADPDLTEGIIEATGPLYKILCEIQAKAKKTTGQTAAK